MQPIIKTNAWYTLVTAKNEVINASWCKQQLARILKKSTDTIILFDVTGSYAVLVLDHDRPYRLGPCNKLFHRRMIRLHTSRIDPFLCGAVRNPNRSPVSRPAGRIRFRGSAEENPVFPVHNLKIVDDHTAKIDAGEADQFSLRLNRADRYRDRNNRLLQDSICPHFYCLINANALDFCKSRPLPSRGYGWLFSPLWRKSPQTSPTFFGSWRSPALW